MLLSLPAYWRFQSVIEAHIGISIAILHITWYSIAYQAKAASRIEVV
jgi:hypothetical protein